MPANASGRGNVVIVLSYWGLNQVLSLFNSWAFRVKGFSFPCLVSVSQSLFYALFALVAAGCGSTRFRHAIASSSSSSAATNRRVRSVAVWATLNVVLNNCSLVYLPLSINQVLRATIPVITALVSVVHGRVPSASEAGALTLIVGGVLVVIGQSLEFSVASHQVLAGLCLCLAGTVAAANGLHATSRALNGGNGTGKRQGQSCADAQLDVVDLAWRIVPWNVALVMPLFFVSELRSLIAYVSADPSGPSSVLWVTGTSSVLASSYNLVHWMLAGRAGPVMTTVLGQLKIVSLVVISRLFLEDDGVNRAEVLGFAIALLGFACYGWIGVRLPAPKSAVE